MTGAACLWAAIGVIFSIAVVGFLIAWACVWYCAEEIKPSLPCLFASLFASIILIVAGYKCQSAYDLNFAVSTKNIQYNIVTERSVDIQMDYKNVAPTQENK